MTRLLQSGAGRQLMQRVRQLHFVGIGGSGMSGLAEVMLNLGYTVSGSDLQASPVTRRLEEMGATLYMGHRAEQVQGADVLVVSSAVPEDNPEVVAARQLRLPVVPRAEMLAELMRFKRGIAVAGTHGKTTTTSLAAAVLAAGELDPTFVVGGLVNATGSHSSLGQGDYLLAEADESDASFLLLQPVMAVVTNIDSDHMDTYGQNLERLDQAFLDFLHHLPFYGLAILCVDDPGVQRILPRVTRTVMTYGESADADLRLLDTRPEGLRQYLHLRLPDGQELHDCCLNLPGRHNALNATAAVALGWELGVSPEAMKAALCRFSGVKRRFHVHGPLRLPRGGEVTFVEDYGHHPTEIRATLQAARSAWPDRRLVLAFQPHRYSRTRDLFEDFAQVLSTADALVLTEVYAAGEDPLPVADGRALSRAIRSRGQVDPVFVEDYRQLPEQLPGLLQDGDVLLLMGAGNIGTLAREIREHGLMGAGGHD